MSHPNEALLREAYAIFGRGDLEGYWKFCSEQFAFNVPGRSQVDDDREEPKQYMEKNIGREQARDEVGDPSKQKQNNADDTIKRTERRHGTYLQRNDSTER